MRKYVYGPYQGKDGRFRVIVNRKTVSYPKYLIEQSLGIKLDKNETVHHIDGNPANNSIDNLQVISRRKHCYYHTINAVSAHQRCIDKYGEDDTFERLRKQGFKPGHIMTKECREKISKTLKARNSGGVAKRQTQRI